MQVEHIKSDCDKDYLKQFSQKLFEKELNNPKVAKITVLKAGTRTVFAGSVYEVQETGNPKRIGLSFQGTTQTIREHDEKESKE
ncbi:MAG: hypothetical protein ABIJ97_11655 [Bacteroidota bacterium]